MIDSQPPLRQPTRETALSDPTHASGQPDTFAFQPIQTTNLREQVHEALRLAIISGHFKAGMRLNERKLAAEFGVSTSPVKEVLRRLEAEGLVRTEPRRGSFVTFSARQAEEMTLARAALESVVAGLAARNASGQDLKRLRGVLAQMKAAIAQNDAEQLVAFNESFHDTIRAASGCTYLITLLDTLRAFNHGTRVSVLSKEDVRAASLHEHTAIFKAIEAHDVSRAEALMRSHITDAGKTHIELLFGPSTDFTGAHE